MNTTLLIMCGVALAIYCFGAALHQLVAKGRETYFLDFISSGSWVIVIRLLMIVVSVVLFFCGAVAVEPIVALVCTAWIVVYSTIGIANSTSSLVNTLAFYEWSRHPYAPLTGFLTALSFILLASIAAGVL
ncbi:MAG: hypothetical protein WBP22_01905 [Candidatus Saccharimonas sp.]